MKYLISLLVMSVLLLAGCARTVSSLDDTLNLEFKLKTSGSTNSDVLYVIAFSTSQQIIPQDPNFDDYFLLPGKNFDDGTLATISDRTISYYYNNFFQYWTKFLYIKQGTVDLIQPASSSFSASINSAENHLSFDKKQGFEYQYKQSSANELTLIIDIDQLNYEAGDSIYFSVITLRSDSSESGFIQDFLIDDSSHQIQFIQYQEKIGDHAESATIDSPFDINQWQYKVY